MPAYTFEVSGARYTPICGKEFRYALTSLSIYFVNFNILNCFFVPDMLKCTEFIDNQGSDALAHRFINI